MQIKMENIKDCEVETGEEEQIDVATVFRNIYCSCDIDNTDLVPVSKLIEFIQPFMIEDLNALEDLKHSLDPDDKDILISSERFYDVIGRWSQKIAAGTSEYDEFQSSSGHLLAVEDKHLPYTHSTPRTSLGDKLLKCKDLLNLSNISGYSLSTSRLDTTNHTDVEKLEEDVKKLEYQLLKLTNELTITKQQLTASEEQNDILQQNFDRLNKRLHAEQQAIEHLQKDKNYNEELREEVNYLKEMVENLKKQLSQSEKDNLYFKNQINELEGEKMSVERKNEVLSRQNQECLKEIIDIKTEVETKEHQIDADQKKYNELIKKYNEQRDLIDQLGQEIDVANYEKKILEKSIKSKQSSMGSSSNLGNSNDFTTPSPIANQNDFQTPPSFNSNVAFQNGSQFKSPLGLRTMVLLKGSSTPLQMIPNLSDGIKISPIISSTSRLQNDNQDSSEEDWKLTPTENESGGIESNGNTESLQFEIHKADPLMMTRSDDIVMFEKDERIAALEDELDNLKSDLTKVKSEKDNITNQLDKLKRINSDLLGRNFELSSDVEISHTKINRLKQKLTQLEQNGVILESIQETFDIENYSRQLLDMEKTLTSKEIIIQELSSKLENTSLLKDEVQKLKNQLNIANDELQRTIAKHEEVKLEKSSLQVMLKSLEQEKHDFNENITKRCECESHTKLKNIKEKLKIKEDEFIIMKQHAEEERIQLLIDFEKQMKEKENEYNKKIKEKESELVEIKDNLEKKIISEFEGKVKDSVETEEKILKLDLKCKQQQKKLNKLLEQLSAKDKNIIEAENHIKSLNNQNSQLHLEINLLQGTISSLEHEQAGKVCNISARVLEIENNLDNRNDLIKELRNLNKKLECSLYEAESNLKGKIDEILNLRNGFMKDIEVKNKLWNQMEILRKELEDIKAANNELIAENEALTQSFDNHKTEHNNLLIIYDVEVKNNIQLSEQIHYLIDEKNRYSSNFNTLKIEFDGLESAIKHQKEMNRQLHEALSELEQTKKSSETEKIDFSSQTEALYEMNKEIDKSLQLENKLVLEISKNNENNRLLKETTQILHERNRELDELKQKIADNELMMKKLDEHVKKNSIISKDLLKAEKLLAISQTELNKLRHNNESLNSELLAKSDQLDATNKIISLKDVQTKENIQELLNKLAAAKLVVSHKQKHIEEAQIIHMQTLNKLDSEKQALEAKLINVNNNLLQKNDENLQLQQKLSSLDQERNQLLSYKKLNQKLQEEIEENKGILGNLCLLKKERNNISSELKEIQTKNSNLQVMLNTRQQECIDLQANCFVLKEKNQQQTELLLQSELLLKQNQEELKKACFQKDLLNNELIRINSMNSSSTLAKNLEETRCELEQQIDDNKKLALDLDEQKKKSHKLKLSNSEKDSRGKSYFRQQATIERLKEKIECLETELRKEKFQTEELKTKLSLTESQILSWESSTEQTVMSHTQRHSSSFSIPPVTEGRTVNKFTLCSSKVQTLCPASPDSPSTNYEVVIEVPSLDINGIANIVQDLDLSENYSSGMTLDREETEKKVLNLISVLRTNSNDVCERIEKHTEKYRLQYEGVLTLLRDVSYRLRDHVCIGTAEPIIPVFVVLEEIKIHLKQLVENVSQVGALIYEDKMRKFWDLVIDYVISVQREHEQSLKSRIRKDTSPTKSALKKRKSKTSPDKGYVDTESSQRKKRLPNIRLTMLFLMIVGVSLIVSIIIHLNCRMTVAESQFCPLDGVITRINDGLPPM